MSFISNKKPIDGGILGPKDVVAATKLSTAIKKLDKALSTSEAEEVFINPLSAGVARGFPGGVTDEAWVQHAANLAKAMGFTRWGLRMLSLLRHDLKGKPYEPLPDPTDPCPCKSRKKYSECCGIGIEEGDPEECKKGNHQYQSWKTTDQGRLVRGCWSCTIFEEAPWAADMEVNGIRIVLIGCKYCGAVPTSEDAKKLMKECEAYDLCAVCGKTIGFTSIHVQHKYLDGIHHAEWTITEAEWKPLYDFTSEALAATPSGNQGVAIHEECLKKAFPFWDKLTSPKYTTARQDQYAFLKAVKDKEQK